MDYTTVSKELGITGSVKIDYKSKDNGYTQNNPASQQKSNYDSQSERSERKATESQLGLIRSLYKKANNGLCTDNDLMSYIKQIDGSISVSSLADITHDQVQKIVNHFNGK